MKIIKIYSKTMVALTTLTEADFTRLSYRRSLGQIGDCTFTLRLDRVKTTNANTKHYNRIQLVEDGVVKFLGVITKRDIDLNSVKINCREMPYVLKKRLLGATYTANGTMIDEVEDILEYVNGVEDTGITLGSVSEAIGSVNNTWKYGNAYSALDDICKATGNQFMITPDGDLVVKPELGTDKSADVIFKYNYLQVSSSNILSFEVEDDGDDIVTTALGKSDSLTASETNSSLATEYGRLEKFKDFRVINNQGVLDDFTLAETEDRVYSPRLDLAPSVNDNFEVGDTVRVILKNELIDIDDSFQVLEKRVEYSRGQKTISVRINDLPKYLAQILNDRDRRLELLEKQV